MKWVLVILAIHYSTDEPSRELHDIKIQHVATKDECHRLAEWYKTNSSYLIKWACING